MTKSRLLAAALCAGLAFHAPAARADIDIAELGNLKLSFGFSGALGAWTMKNVDFGRGNFNTKSTTGVRRERTWSEGYAKPSLSFEYTLDDARGYLGRSSSFYGTVSFLATGTVGGGDGVATMSTTSLRPMHGTLEEAFVGWRSGDLFDFLGDDAVDFSIGTQPLTIGDGLQINGSVFNGFQRGGYYLAPRAAFEKTIVLKVDAGALVPLRGTFFHLGGVSNQSLLKGLDQPKARLAGASVEWYGPKRDADLGAIKDLWNVSATYFNIYAADQAGPGSPAGNRNGLNVYSVRAAGSFVPFDRDILFFGEYIRQINNNPGRKADATGWYVEPGYQFSSLPWAPIITFRYASFSGDGDPNGGGTKKSFDSLYFGSGVRGLGPGTWYMGEIYGWYLQSLTNVTVQQIGLRATPTEDLTIGANYYRIDFNKLGQVNQLVSPGGGVTSKRAMDELDLYAEWKPYEWLTVTPTLAFGFPGAGYKQVATGTGYGGSSTIVLGQVVMAVKF